MYTHRFSRFCVGDGNTLGFKQLLEGQNWSKYARITYGSYDNAIVVNRETQIIREILVFFQQPKDHVKISYLPSRRYKLGRVHDKLEPYDKY